MSVTELNGGLKAWAKYVSATAGGIMLATMALGLFQAAQEFKAMRITLEKVSESVDNNTETTAELARELSAIRERLDSLKGRLDRSDEVE